MTELMMETVQELIGSHQDVTQIIKGKRTKRQRPPSPLTLAMTPTSSSCGENGSGEHERVSNSTLSRSNSVELAESTGEEEDMANCLILLAQGHKTCKPSEPVVIATTVSKATGLYVYECKTCNRCFPSFQALGGHRASHKKPKAINEEKKASAVTEEGEDKLGNMNTTLSLQIANRGSCGNNKSNKVHECSICGAEFASGQALGGHMRRHRAFASTLTTTTATSLGTSSPGSQESKKQRNSLQLDLNLPAPEDDLRESKFHFATKEQVLAFSASPLVDCHY